ncbi:hypothetical protein ACRALDRAFT_1080122 [Sodiomyces alcalophilus JCM 7366]|uniref:uncharacterized protein n=1 Tax=Sodiomyces alcalophilus JCM 7366 TaxID=591952 RepID=UPI0039B5C6FD
MTQGAHPPPSTPTPRRFLLSKRGPASSVSSSQQQQQQQQDQEATPAPRQFQVAPWGGSNSQRFQTTPRFAPPSSSANTPPGPRSSTPAGLTLLGFGFPGTQRRQRDDPIRDDGSEDGGDLSPLWRARDAPSVARWDSIEVDSTSSISTMSVQDQDEGVTSDMATELKGPTPKRRRVEVSSEDEEEEEEEEEDEEEGDGESMSESMSVEEEPPGDSNEEELSDALPESPLGQACENGIQQPTFRPAPRFKLSESDQTARLEGLPEAFSPQRRGASARPLIFKPPLAFFSPRAAFSSINTCSRQDNSDPLRILFCGSDEFSIAALEALHREHVSNHSLVESINVVVRPGKPTGRGMKSIREVPLKSTAQQLGLPVHELNTFTGWTPSFDINLIVAVSFGLLVPPRLLHLAKYGGLNLHPSLLPDLRGPAPLHHTLLQNRQYTGVTLQTLHESKFDHGIILDQTPSPGIPVPPDADLPTLHNLVTPPAAEMLIQGLRRGLYVPPLQPVQRNQADGEECKHAPKLTKDDRRVRWRDWVADDFVRRWRVLGPLWGQVRVPSSSSSDGPKSVSKRLILEDVEAVPLTEVDKKESSTTRLVTWVEGNGKDGMPDSVSHVVYFDSGAGDGSVLMIPPRGGDAYLRVAKIKAEGDKSKPAARVLLPLSDEGPA